MESATVSMRDLLVVKVASNTDRKGAIKGKFEREERALSPGKAIMRRAGKGTFILDNRVAFLKDKGSQLLL